jgi:hypothetical protein
MAMSTILFVIRFVPSGCERQRAGKRPKLFDRADTDAVCLAQSAVDGPRFRHAHFGAADFRGHIRRVGVAVTNEAAAVSWFMDRRLEYPATSSRIAELAQRPDVNTCTAMLARKAQQTGMSDIPTML